VEGCERIVKSQGLCQRHGAKTRKCKYENCQKQAQGNFDGMCKAHFKLTKTQLIDKNCKPPSENTPPPPPEGESVYDSILPASIGWTSSSTNDISTMPLVAHLKDGFDKMKPRGWHRNAERRARGLFPVPSPAVQLEGWERELVWMEICILSGCPQASFRHLARAWGRDKGFHIVLATFICERRGNVERKKRGKGENVTKKAKRVPVELSPGGDEIMQQVMGLDDVDLDMLGVLEEDSPDFDPTLMLCGEASTGGYAVGSSGHAVTASWAPPASAPAPPPVAYVASKGKRGKRRPHELNPLDDELMHSVHPHPGKVLMTSREGIREEQQTVPSSHTGAGSPPMALMETSVPV